MTKTEETPEETPWYEEDTVVTLVPKFKIKDGMVEEFVSLMPKFVDIVKANEKGACAHYGFVSLLFSSSS